MPNEVNIYTPRYLAEVVRQAPPIHTGSASLIRGWETNTAVS